MLPNLCFKKNAFIFKCVCLPSHTRAWSGGAGLSAAALAAVTSRSALVGQAGGGATRSGGGGTGAHGGPGDPAIGGAQQTPGRAWPTPSWNTGRHISVNQFIGLSHLCLGFQISGKIRKVWKTVTNPFFSHRNVI